MGFLLEGGFLPYFFAMLSAELQGRIEGLIQSTFPEVFVVDMSLSHGKHSALILRIDTDKGISMDEIMEVSRAVGWMIEEEDLIKSAYNLEVSSPGVGKPLKVLRQYSANIGRYLAVQTLDGKDLRGQLLTVTEQGISLEILAKSKKKKPKPDQEEEGPLHIPFDQIQTAKVIII